MKKHLNKMKIVLFITSTSLLIGCGSTFSSQNNSQPKQLFGNQVSMLNITDLLTVHAVEFTSKVSVPNVGVALLDFETGEEISRATVNEKGIAEFDMVIHDVAYEIVIYGIDKNGEWLEQTRKSIVYDSEKPTVSIETFYADSKKGLAVPIVKQKPELPNGCEITALTAILNYYGYKVDKMDLVKNYLPTAPVKAKGNKVYGPDPNFAYAGDPTKVNGGYYVFAQPIVDVANDVLFEKNSDYRAMNLSNESREQIKSYVQSGVPVLTWVTIDWKEPRQFGSWIIEETNEKHSIFMNLHSVVLTGFSKGKVTVMNPLTGYETIDEETFFKSYEALGSHAIVIL